MNSQNLRTIFNIVSGLLGAGILFMPYEMQHFGINSLIALSFVIILFTYLGIQFTQIKGDSIFSIKTTENLEIPNI